MRLSCIVVALLAICATSAYYIPPPMDNIFRDIKGDYCSRRPGEQCCPGRNDGCRMPIRDTMCYCDMFCNRTVFDCCPDFWSICIGSRQQEVKATEALNRCFKDGVLHVLDTVYKENCNECTCAPEPQAPDGLVTYGWRCTNHVCLIRPEIIQSVNAARHGWKASNYTEFWGMTLMDGLKYRLGTFPPERPVKRMLPLKVNVGDILPLKFDSREKWPLYIHPVRNQRNCGASWAFSTTAVASDRLAIQSQGMFSHVLSPQNLLSCNVHKQSGCEGGRLDRAWWYMRKIGAVMETCYPYKSGLSSEKGKCFVKRGNKAGHCPGKGRYDKDKIFKATPPYRISSQESEIMKEIQTNGPVQATFLVKEDFFMYRAGVYRHSGITTTINGHSESGYHSVRIIGWGQDVYRNRRVQRYWLCANSWGPAWGEQGYFRIARGVNECKIESFVVAVWSKVGNRRYHGGKGRRRRILSN